MTAKFVRERITQLRLQKGISEYKMSYDLGHSRGYINNISSGKALPSLNELFAICDYFQITINEFFDDKMKNPKLISEVIENIEKMDEEDIALVKQLINRLLNK